MPLDSAGPAPRLHRVRCLALCALFLAAVAPLRAEPAAAPDVLPRHPLEDRALVEPDVVLRELPPLLQQAQGPGQALQRTLLQLARANACRVIADWACQRDAGEAARAAARDAGDPRLEVRGLIAASRAMMSLQDYSAGESLLGEAELRLREAPLPELAADIHLAYSSMSYALGKHALAGEYAQRGLATLGADEALPLQVRLLRNLARAQAQLDDFDAARDTLQRALDTSARVDDPKLRGELHLESARLARRMGDIDAQRASAQAVLALAGQLRNSQLGGQAHEALGLAALDAGDTALALAEFGEARDRFLALGLARDELRVTRGLIDVMLAQARPAAELGPVVQRYLALDREVMQADRAQAADDFDARLTYAQQQTQVLKLEGEAMLAQERERTLETANRLTRFLNLAATVAVLLLLAFFVLQRRANLRLRAALRAQRESASQATDLLRLSTGYVFLHDLQGRVLMMNPAAAEALGTAVNDMPGRDVRDFITQDGREDFETYLQRLRGTGRAEGTLRVRRADGGERHWRYGNRLSLAAPGQAYVVGHAVDVTEQLAETEVLRERSERDPLTGSWNRRYLPEFERSQRGKGPWAVVNIDLDHFKQINDRHGHEHGDRVLIEFARFLQQRVREHDAVVRAGGDEFLVLLADSSEPALLALIERLQQDTMDAPCGFSLGWALREGNESLSDTLARADARMYERRRRRREASDSAEP